MKIHPTLSAIFARDHGRCCLCGEPVDPALKAPHPDAPTRDHVLPKSRGGCSGPHNLQLAHLRCNVARGNRPLASAPAPSCRQCLRRMGALARTPGLVELPFTFEQQHGRLAVSVEEFLAWRAARGLDDGRPARMAVG